MKIRFANASESANWNDIILQNPDGGNITQCVELADIKAKSGWVKKLVISNFCAMTVHERKIPLLGKIWYIPKGPGISSAAEIKQLLPELRKFAFSKKVFLVKIEPELIKNNENIDIFNQERLIASHNIQPNSSTVVLDISKTLDETLANLPQKARHAIKRAYRDGLTTKLVEPTQDNYKIMLDLMHQTMADKSVKVRDDAYYINFWDTYIKSNKGALFFAYQDNKPIAGAFVLKFGEKATYKDGGSVREKTIYGASHALQWHIIEWLKTFNITSYDLCGAPPASEIGNKNHPHYGIGLFKTGFNKTVTEYVGVYDMAINQFTYKIWSSFGERLICQIYARLFKKLFY